MNSLQHRKDEKDISKQSQMRDKWCLRKKNCRFHDFSTKYAREMCSRKDAKRTLKGSCIKNKISDFPIAMKHKVRRCIRDDSVALQEWNMMDILWTSAIHTNVLAYWVVFCVFI